MNIVVVGTGYVGLVTGVALAHIGHRVTCVDVDEEKVNRMRQGISPIYEPGIEQFMKENMEANRLFFTTDGARAYREADVIYIAVGTPENEDGSANLTYIYQAVKDIASSVTKDVIIVTKVRCPSGRIMRCSACFNSSLRMCASMSCRIRNFYAKGQRFMIRFMATEL